MPDLFTNRVVELNDRLVDPAGECLIYWMQRSQRAHYNLSLEYAIERANELAKPLVVYFGLYDYYPMGSRRAFQFMLEGLRETAFALAGRGLGLVLRLEHPAEGVVAAAEELNACAVVVDEDYINVGRQWRAEAARHLEVPLVQVDAETIVPARNSGKEEWGAYTLRPKTLKVLDQHMVAMPESHVDRQWTTKVDDSVDLTDTDLGVLAESLHSEQQVGPDPFRRGGASAAEMRLSDFIEKGLPRYQEERNDIGVDVSSGISPYLHFGQVSPLWVALAVSASDAPDECVDAFLEQLIVRRELAINFCQYNRDYATLSAAPEWAQKTLREHWNDPRTELYTVEELEAAQTDDDLWNASQTELVKTGKIHPYMRMVWAKKMLEWLPTPEEALSCAIYLNDKYALDGRDPNGYANIAWCIYGKHDRPFAERPIFGKVRYMSTKATKAKTHWHDYVARIASV